MSIASEAVRLAGLLKTSTVYATADVSTLQLPCLLVEPIPARTYDPTLCDGTAFTVTWRVVALTNAPGDLAAARALEKLTDHAVSVLNDEGLSPQVATGALYQPSIGGNPLPAVILTVEGGQTWLGQ